MPRRKVLKAVAHNLLDSLLSGPSGRFDGSLFDHLEAAAVSADVPAIELDIMGQCVRPERASTGALLEIAVTAKQRLQELVVGVGLLPAAVAQA